MGSAKDIIESQIDLGRRLIDTFTGTLTDEEYLMPPMDGLDHIAWLLLHVASVWDRSTSILANTKGRLPESIHEHCGSGVRPPSDRSDYPSRSEIDAMFRTALSSVLEALHSADDGTWDAPSPVGFPRDLFPTLGAAWGIQATHLFWHIGQVTTCRAAMGKKHVLV